MSENSGLTIRFETVTKTEPVEVNGLLMEQIRKKAARKGIEVGEYIGRAIGLQMDFDDYAEMGDRILIEHKNGHFSELKED